MGMQQEGGCGHLEWDKMWAWPSWSRIRCGPATGRWVYVS